MTPTDIDLDVRGVEPRFRHEQIFEVLVRLPLGGAVQLTNDHDPRPLWYQLQAEQAGQFSWTYLEQGPACWRVRIERIAAAPSSKTDAQLEVPAGELYLDNRGLEPPEPLVRILEALERLGLSQELVSDLDREPLLLYPQLANRGFTYVAEAQDDGGYRVRIRRAE